MWFEVKPRVRHQPETSYRDGAVQIEVRGLLSDTLQFSRLAGIVIAQDSLCLDSGVIA